MTILVTGAAGLLGGEIVRALDSGGRPVRALVRSARDVPGATEIAIADIEDSAALRRAIDGCDALVHVAGILLGPALARVISSDRPSVVVVVSSSAIRTRHRSSAMAYAAGESAIRSARPDAVIVRPTMIYGSVRDRNVHHVIRVAAQFRLLPVFGAGTARIQPIHYVDLALAIANLIDGPAGATFDAAGPEPLTLREAGATIFRALGLRPRFVRLPLAPSAFAAGLFGHRARERILRFAEDRVGDPVPLMRRTGITPRPFAEGVRAEVAEMGLR